MKVTCEWAGAVKKASPSIWAGAVIQKLPVNAEKATSYILTNGHLFNPG